jgi:hypothetical protein
MIISRLVLLRIINVSYRICRDSQDKFYTQYIFSENHAIYEIMWGNMVEPEKLHVYNMVRAHCITPIYNFTGKEKKSCPILSRPALVHIISLRTYKVKHLGI